MAIIDSQVHAYEANTPKRPWHSVPNWPDHVTGDEMVAAMDKIGVDGAIFIAAFSMYRYDASYAVEVQRAHPGRFDLAKRPNAVLKVSGACTLSRESYPFPDIWDPLARVFDAWGFDRCLWGTDWTRAFAVVNYEQAVEPFRQTDRLSDNERTMLMGGACAKAYGWSPKKG
jgi:predicted TIM-barrel fold metal-dependent hydrolase